MTHPLPPLVAERLRALRERPVEPTEKGFGLLASGLDGPAPAGLAGSAPTLYEAALPGVAADRALAVGDRLDTDIEGAVAAGIEGELALREQRTGRVETVQMWGRGESARQEFRRLRAQ